MMKHLVFYQSALLMKNLIECGVFEVMLCCFSKFDAYLFSFFLPLLSLLVTQVATFLPSLSSFLQHKEKTKGSQSEHFTNRNEFLLSHGKPQVSFTSNSPFVIEFTSVFSPFDLCPFTFHKGLLLPFNFMSGYKIYSFTRNLTTYSLFLLVNIRRYFTKSKSKLPYVLTRINDLLFLA